MKKLLFMSSLLVVALFTFAFTSNTTVAPDATIEHATEITHCDHDHAITADTDTETNDDAVVGKCIYCGGSSVGTTCSKAPHGKCVIHKAGKCSYCGGSSVGTTCQRSATGYCAIPKDGKCTFCGGSAIGTSCRKSPSGKCSKAMPK